MYFAQFYFYYFLNTSKSIIFFDPKCNERKKYNKIKRIIYFKWFYIYAEWCQFKIAGRDLQKFNAHSICNDSLNFNLVSWIALKI